jgi:hypothetical protein
MRFPLAGMAFSVALVLPLAASAIELATIVRPPTAYTPRICVYAQGSKLFSCAVTGIGPRFAIGQSCYCGNSPKGIIRAAPITLSPG